MSGSSEGHVGVERVVVKRDTSVMVEAAEGATVGQLAEGLVLGLKDVK